MTVEEHLADLKKRAFVLASGADFCFFLIIPGDCSRLHYATRVQPVPEHPINGHDDHGGVSPTIGERGNPKYDLREVPHVARDLLEGLGDVLDAHLALAISLLLHHAGQDV